MAAFLPAPLPPARASAPTAPLVVFAPLAIGRPAGADRAGSRSACNWSGSTLGAGRRRPAAAGAIGRSFFAGVGSPARLLSRGRPAAAGQGARFEFAVRAELGGPDVDSPLPPAPTGSDAPVSGGSNGAGAASPARKPDAPGGQAAGLACPLPSPSAEAGAAKQTEPTADREQQPFEWRKNWYPVAFVEDFPRGRPYPFSLFDEPLVLWAVRPARPAPRAAPRVPSSRAAGRRARGGAGEGGAVRCVLDRCPHRAVPLSDGRLEGPLLECGYHGWQFDGSGRCARIPQLEAGAAINQRRACVAAYPVALAQGIIFVPAPPRLPSPESL
eukprot:tig00020510_g9801.t1